MPTIVARGQITITEQVNNYTYFRYSDDGQTFTAPKPWVSTPLPKGYLPADYIQGNGGYIDTGVEAASPIKVNIRFLAPQNGDYSLLGARKGNIRLYPAHIYNNALNVGYSSLYRVDAGDYNKFLDVTSELRNGLQFCSVGGTTKYTAQLSTDVALGLNLYLFACNVNGTANYFAPAATKIGRCQIYTSGVTHSGYTYLEMIRDFVPCINPDGIAGFYDVVQQRFYGSANNKAFTAAATDLTGKELVSDSDTLNSAGNTEIIRNRAYYLVNRTIPAELRGRRLSVSAKVQGLSPLDMGVCIDAYTTKQGGGFFWTNGLRPNVVFPDADGYIHIDNIRTEENSTDIFFYTRYHLDHTKDDDNPIVTLSELMITATPTAQPFAPMLEEQRQGTSIGTWLGTQVSTSPYPSKNFADYAWTKIAGKDGTDGRDGAAGASLGRNLFRNADFHTSEDIRDVSGAIVFRLTGGSITGETFNGSGVLKDKCNFYVHNLPSGAYTLSFWSKNAPNDILIDTNNRVYVEVFRCTANNSAGGWGSSYIAAIYDTRYYPEWTKHTLTFNFKREIVMDNGDTYDYDSIRVLFYASGHTIYTSQPKLEIGETSTDFCLNEEDQKGRDGTSITPKGQLTSSADLPTTAQKGDSYIIDGFLWVYTGSNITGAVRGFVNAGSIKGPSGASSYVHIAYANSADGTVDFTTKDDADDGKTYLFVGICVDTNPADPTDVNRYKWTALAAEPVRPNILYQAGFEEGRIDYWQAGQALANTKIDINACNGRNALTLTGNDGALVAQNIGDRLQPNRWYTMSFYAKVKAGIHVLATGGFIESNAAGGHFAPLPDSTDLDLLSLSPNSDYKFYSVTFKTRPTLPAGDKFLSFTLWGDGSSICMPKLEEGQTATTFVVHENDLKASTPRPCGQWSSNVTYENNRLYIDVVSYNGQYYSCKRTNVGQEPAANSQYWEAANKMKFVATDLLLAESAFIDNLGVRTIATRANGPRFIAEAGKWAIFGNHEKPSIESWVDGNGNAHLRFYDADGNPTYDLGPEGARNMMASSGFDIIGMSNYMPVNWSDEQVKEKLISYATNGLDKVKYTNYYQYRSVNNPLTKQYDGKIFTNGNNELSLSNTPLCEDGRYIMIGTASESSPQFNGDGGLVYNWALVTGVAKVVTIKNGLIKSDKYIRWSRKVYNNKNVNQ